MFKRKNKGFTLIELLVVIAIIGVLASVVLASLNSARKKSRDARRVADIKQIQLALEMYFDSTQSYPTTLAALAPTYIATVSTDPLTSVGAYKYAALTSGSSITTCTTGCTYYHLGAILEEATNPALPGRDLDSSVATNGFPGATANCGATAGTNCYDITP